MDPYPNAGPESGPVLSWLRRAIVAVALDDPVIREHLRLALRIHTPEPPSKAPSLRPDLSHLRWTRTEMMAELGCGSLTLQELTRRRDNPIPSLKVGRQILYPKEAVTKWLNENQILPGGRTK